jgi:hypothetical protein
MSLPYFPKILEIIEFSNCAVTIGNLSYLDRYNDVDTNNLEIGIESRIHDILPNLREVKVKTIIDMMFIILEDEDYYGEVFEDDYGGNFMM